MKTIDQIQLAQNQRQALAEIQKLLMGAYGIEQITLYGSVSRQESDNESDIDLLLVTHAPLERSVRHQITDIVCEINLRNDTNFSTLVVDRDTMENGLYSILPLHDEIFRDGIAL